MRSDHFRWMVLDLVLASVAACGGISVDDQQLNAIQQPVADADAGATLDPRGVVPPVDTGGSQETVVINGWRWNVACPRSIDALCANGGVERAPCVRDWSTASDPASWCVDPTINEVAILPPCNGRQVVGIFGSTPSFGTDTLFLYYFYDATTGELLHVDSDGVPSVSTCVAGVSGSRYDTFGCGSPAFTTCR